MNALARSAREMALALQYFTRVPLPPALARWTGFDERLQRGSLAHFPGVGFVVAGAAIAAYAAAQLLLPRSVFTLLAAALASIIATVLLTGALHEDGLADTVDGLAASPERERALQVMKDSRLGAAGAMALAVAVLAKLVLLSSIGGVAGLAGVAAALLGGHVVSRGLALTIVATLPHIGSAGTSKSLPVAQRIERTGLAIAGLWCTAALLLAASLSSLAVSAAGVVAAVVAVLAMRRLLARRLAGFTGDGLGATQQVCEIAFCFGVAVAS